MAVTCNSRCILELQHMKSIYSITLLVVLSTQSCSLMQHLAALPPLLLLMMFFLCYVGILHCRKCELGREVNVSLLFSSFSFVAIDVVDTVLWCYACVLIDIICMYDNYVSASCLYADLYMHCCYYCCCCTLLLLLLLLS
jgi:hypothetical protein